MKITRTYTSGCVWCNARGFVSNPISGAVSDAVITCPVCNGNKTILIAESFESAEPVVPIKDPQPHKNGTD